MKYQKLIALFLLLTMLTGCAILPGGDSMSTEPTQETQPVDPVLEKAILRQGNGARLQAKIRAAQQGEDITIAYIGGSITEGPDVKYAERYVTLSSREFEENYCNGGKVTCINAGLSGTPSNLGVLRLERDVLAYQPDIVFVEFAVNDSQDRQEQQCFESLVRTVLEQENAPAVVLLFNRTEDGYTCQNLMGLTGMYYDLPMISVRDAVTMLLEEGKITWQDFSDDSVHPNAYGHRLTADFIAYLFRLADKGTWEEYSVPKTKQFKAPYMNAVMITPEMENTQDLTITNPGDFSVFRGNRTGFTHQWRIKGNGNGLCFTVTGNAVFLVYNRNKTEIMGAVDVYVNGEKKVTVNAKDPDGWGDPYSTMIVKSTEIETFEIEIRPAEGNEDKIFDIFAIAYTQNG